MTRLGSNLPLAARGVKVWFGPIALIRCPKHHAALIPPRQRGALGKLHNRNGRDLPSEHQPLQRLWREVGQAQLPADMALCESNGFGQFLDRAEY
jgi:hypothetical protein